MAIKAPTTTELFRLDEPGWMARLVAASGAESVKEVEQWLHSARFIIDWLMCSNHVLVLWDGVYSWGNNPVAAALLSELLKPGADGERAGDLVADEDDDQLMRLLEVPAQIYERSPIRTFRSVLGMTAHEIDIRARDAHSHPLYDVLDTLWAGLVDRPPARQYRPLPAGPEKDFDRWLTENLSALGEAYPIVPADVGPRGGQQWRTVGGHRADLVCRFTDTRGSYRSGDWLVIENKTVAVDSRAVIQLQHYVDAVRSQLAKDDEHVAGLLIADGFTSDADEALISHRLESTTLANLGYRDHIFRANKISPSDEQGIDLARQPLNAGSADNSATASAPRDIRAR